MAKERATRDPSSNYEKEHKSHITKNQILKTKTAEASDDNLTEKKVRKNKSTEVSLFSVMVRSPAHRKEEGDRRRYRRREGGDRRRGGRGAAQRKKREMEPRVRRIVSEFPRDSDFNFREIFARLNENIPRKFRRILKYPSEFRRNIPRKYRGTSSKTLNKGYISVIQTAKHCFRFKNPTSSEFPRNIPREFRGNPYLPRNSVGIFRGNTEELVFGKTFLSASPVPQTGVCHSTFESLRLGCSSQSIVSGFLRFWDSLNLKIDREFVGITVLFLDEKITDHLFPICFISLTIIDEVITGAPEINIQSRLDYVIGQIRYVQGSDLTKETTRVVIRLLIDP
ncbi:LOW QUALITY PROTEIN: hypothetical protein YC2023_118318 [Brassica napus]